MKKMRIGNCNYNVIPSHMYYDNPSHYNTKHTAFLCGNMVLPIRTPADKGVGVQITSSPNMMCYNIAKPTSEEADMYDASRIIDFDNVKDMSEYIQKNELVNNMQSELIQDKDKIFVLPIDMEKNSPEMIGFKTFVNLKQINIDNYSDRFPQYQNDLRVMRDDKITSAKLKQFASNLDANIVMMIFDKDGAVNPAGRPVYIPFNFLPEEFDEFNYY